MGSTGLDGRNSIYQGHLFLQEGAYAPDGYCWIMLDPLCTSWGLVCLVRMDHVCGILLLGSSFCDAKVKAFKVIKVWGTPQLRACSIPFSMPASMHTHTRTSSMNCRRHLRIHGLVIGYQRGRRGAAFHSGCGSALSGRASTWSQASSRRTMVTSSPMVDPPEGSRKNPTKPFGLLKPYDMFPRAMGGPINSARH